MTSLHSMNKSKSKTSVLGPILARPELTKTKDRYDIASGQIFSETEVAFVKRYQSDWIGELKTPSLLKRPRPNKEGARSLLEMARTKVARQLKQLTADHFLAVPWGLSERVWEEVVAIHGESFHAWRTLASAYPSVHEFGKPKFRYQLEIKQPSLTLSEYFTGIASPQAEWLTSLRISPKQLGTTDLVSCAKVNNLAALDLSDGQVTIANRSSPYDARVMRSWAELASKGAFSHLRVLLLGWQEHVSSWIFDYVDQFPSLCYIIMTDCAKMHQKNRAEWEGVAQEHGWVARHAKRSTKSLRPLINDGTFYLGSVSGCYYDSQQLFEQLRDKTNPTLRRRPMLECWIGNPRVWSHVIDDFPGTRTIFFEKTAKLDAQWRPTIPKPNTAAAEQVKRVRQTDQPPSELRSPPHKRGPISKHSVRSKEKTASDLLHDLMS